MFAYLFGHKSTFYSMNTRHEDIFKLHSVIVTKLLSVTFVFIWLIFNSRLRFIYIFNH